MKILFIHEVNYETKVIFEMHEFPELLALRGHEVHFLHFPERMGFKHRKLRSELKEISGRAYPEARLTLITPPTFGGNFIDRLNSTVSSIPLIHWILKNKRYDVIVLMSVPTTGWQTSLLAKRYRTPILFRALDVSHLLRSEISKKLVFWAERIVYRNVQAISANNSALANYCSSHNSSHVPMFINYPPLDLSHFHSASNSVSVREKYGIAPDDFVIMFMGTLYEFSGLDILMRQIASGPKPDFKLVIVGGGKNVKYFHDLSQELELQNSVIFTDVVPYAQLPEVLGIANVAINPFVPSLITDVAFPHKVLQYLASGLNTVSTKLNGLHGALGDDAGVFWVSKTEEILEKALELRAIDKSELEAAAKKGRDFVTRTFEKEKVVIEFEKTLEKVIAT